MSFPERKRTFKKVTGRSVHEEKAHKDWYDAQIVPQITHKKERWSLEEKEMLARKEAKLIYEGHNLVNKLLEEAFPTHSFESIKGVRRRASHKQQVQRYLTCLKNETDTSDEGLNEDEIERAEHINPNEKLLNYFKQLTQLDETNKLSIRLNNLCKLACKQKWQDIEDLLGLFIKDAIPTNKPRDKVRKTPKAKQLNNKKKRRAEYA